MAEIPSFKNPKEEERYYTIFDEKVDEYKYMFDKVKYAFFGDVKGYLTLPGQAYEVLRDITSSLIYDTTYQFKDEFPEHKRDDDDIFIPRKGFREEVASALLEANKKFWNESNETHFVENDGLTEYTLGEK